MTTTGTAKKYKVRKNPGSPRPKLHAQRSLRERKSSYGLGTEIALLFEGIGLKKDIPELRTYDREISNPKIAGLRAANKRAY
jgi:hypothetical protein